MNNLQQMVPTRIFFALLTLSLGTLSVTNAETNAQNQQPNSAENSTTLNHDENALDYIPRWVDATQQSFLRNPINLRSHRLPKPKTEPGPIKSNAVFVNGLTVLQSKLMIGLVMSILKIQPQPLFG